MSYKNILQEWCQKNKKPIPVYTDSKSGFDHQPLWDCSIKIDNTEFQVTHCLSKQEAQQNVAKHAYEHLRKLFPEQLIILDINLTQYFDFLKTKVVILDFNVGDEQLKKYADKFTLLPYRFTIISEQHNALFIGKLLDSKVYKNIQQYIESQV